MKKSPANENLLIRKMEFTDYEALAHWLSTREVLEFFRDVNAPFTLDQVKAKYGPRINGDAPIYPYIVELNNRPIGFMQHYKLSEDKQTELGYPISDMVFGIDQFIGIPELYGKGLGTLMVNAFTKQLTETTEVQIITVDPEVSNLRAIKCYEKCGFQKVKKLNEETCWLMELKVSR